MAFLLILFVGLAVGVIARVFMHDREPAAVVVPVAVGMGGALVGASVGWAAGWTPDAFAAPGLAGFLVVAVLMLAVYGTTVGRRTLQS